MTNSIYINQGHTSSIFEDEYVDEEVLAFKKQELQLSVFDAGYIFSIELRRERTRKSLEHLFDFASQTKEVDFISSSNELYNLLPSIGEFFQKEISKGSRLSLELMEEENNWKTLFINVPFQKDSDWSRIYRIIDSFYDNMFELFPSAMEKINVDLVSYEI